MNKATKVSTWTVPDELQAFEAARLQKIEEENTLKRKAEDESQPPAKAEKPKRKRTKVIHSLADIEDAELKQSMLAQIEEESHRVEKEAALKDASTAEDAGLAATDLTSDETKAIFKAMLSEKDVNPLAPWDTEMPKFVNDSRYSSKLISFLCKSRDL